MERLLGFCLFHLNHSVVVTCFPRIFFFFFYQRPGTQAVVQAGLKLNSDHFDFTSCVLIILHVSATILAFLVFFKVLGIESGAIYVLSRHSSTELRAYLTYYLTFRIFLNVFFVVSILSILQAFPSEASLTVKNKLVFQLWVVLIICSLCHVFFWYFCSFSFSLFFQFREPVNYRSWTLCNDIFHQFFFFF